MTELVTTATSAVVALLSHYSFDSEELTIDQLADQWLQAYPVDWIHLALVEALHQGRYKAVSVTQILVFWQRRGQPLYRFDPEFEQLVCNRLPKKLLAERQPKSNTPTSGTGVRSHTKVQQVRSNATISLDLTEQKTAQNPLPTQAKANLTPSLPKLVPDSLPETIHSITSRNNQALRSPDVTRLSNAEIGKLNQALPAPLVQMDADQSELTAANASQTAWSELEKYPIHRFIPDTEASGFHTKLSAIAQRHGTRVALAERGGRSR